MNGITKSKSTKLLSALLAVLMIVAMLPTTAFAWSVEEGTKCTSTYYWTWTEYIQLYTASVLTSLEVIVAA